MNNGNKPPFKQSLLQQLRSYKKDILFKPKTKKGFSTASNLTGIGTFYILYLTLQDGNQPYRSFSVTIAITTHKMVTIQKRTAILLS